jgi:hypothetical protein
VHLQRRSISVLTSLSILSKCPPLLSISQFAFTSFFKQIRRHRQKGLCSVFLTPTNSETGFSYPTLLYLQAIQQLRRSRLHCAPKTFWIAIYHFSIFNEPSEVGLHSADPTNTPCCMYLPLAHLLPCWLADR